MSDKKEKDSKVKSSKAKKNVEKTQEVSVSAEKKIFPHSCTDCGVLNCSKRNASYPEFCLTEKLTEKELEKVVKLYTENEVEGGFYGKYTRVEEIMEVAKRIGAKKIGIATCVGLIEESRIFARILKLNGFDVYGVACKVGSVDKTDIGLDPKYTCKTGPVMCNPILQAKLLNKAVTHLNVVVGLCVGHDSLFYKYSKALATTLVTKDRVLAHNPVGALYQTRAYYKRLLQQPLWDDEDDKKEEK